MDAYLKLSATVLSALAWASVHASDFSDPTVPPAALRAPSGAAEGTPSAATIEPLRLQMIVRGPGERRSALIDGRAVHVGDVLTTPSGAARVLRMTDSTLVLKLADGATETLELAPAATQMAVCKRELGAQVTPCQKELHKESPKEPR